MSRINVLIVDDEPNCIETLCTLLEEYHENINILACVGNIQDALQKIEEYRKELDILFLDVQMPGGDGFSLLQQIPNISFKVVFTTAYDQFAIKAIKFSALDYLLKPIDNEELTTALDKYHSEGNGNVKSYDLLKQNVTEKRSFFDKLAVPTTTEIKFIPTASILYFESSNNYTIIHIDDKQKIISSKNIGFYEDLLAPQQFYRCHNSYLINIDKVTRFVKGKNGMVELNHSIFLDVSGRRKDELLAILGI